MSKELTAKELLKDIKAYKKTFKGNFTEKKYHIRENLEKKALFILTDFQNEKLILTDELKKPMALYIHMFSDYKKTALLAQLQKKTEFDVLSYINESQKTLWQKVFGSDNKYKAMNAKEMLKKCEKYKKLYKNRSQASVITKIDNMSREADRYARNILNNLTVVPNKDIAATQEYFHTIGGHLYEGSDIYNVLQKLDKQKQSATVSDTSKNIAHQQSAAKITHISFFSGFKKKISALKNKVKTAAVIAGIGIIGFVGFKTAHKTTTTKQNTIAMQQNLTEKSKVKTPTAQFIAQKQKNNIQADKKSSIDKIWKNYYDSTIELLTSKTKRDMLYKQIESQIAAGNFYLPQNISVEKAAYAKVIYDKYNLKSSLNKAFSANQKLSENEQKNLVNDILAVGDKGVGAKKMAMRLHKGKLSSFSHYDTADKAQKSQHISVLSQIKKINSGNLH